MQYVDVPGYAALILRRTFRQLDQPDAIMSRSKEWLMPHRASGVHWNDDAKRWTFPSGATLTFGYLDHDNDVFNYQGPAYQFIGWDELTQFDEKPYRYLFSRTRRRKDLQALGIPIRHRSASNPGGVGHAWVKARFIEPKTRRESAIFIPAKVDDNPGLDVDEYKQSLSELDETLRKQLLDGNWGVFEGAAYPMFDPRLHVIEPFDVPEPWERFESVDPGSTNPCAWLAWATDYDGNHVVFGELYVEEPSPHLPSDIVPLLAECRADWWPDGHRPVAYADPAAFAPGAMTKWGRPPAFADEFSTAGMPLIRANNDRPAGYVRIAELLKPDPDHAFPSWHPRAGQPGSPRLFIFAGCTNLIEQLQGAPLERLGEPHPGEAVSRKWEGPWGHAHAALRYGALTWAGPSEEPEKPLDDPRAELLRQYMKRRDENDRSRLNYELV